MAKDDKKPEEQVSTQEAPKDDKKPEEKSSKYQVRVTNEFRSITGANRMSAGLSIGQDGNGYIGSLTDEQLKELKNDNYVTVEPYKS